NVENSNIVITASGTLPLEGKIQIQNGNLLLYTGGLTINISDEGGLYLIDSDNNGDGIIDLNWGGITLNNNGEAYVEGLKASGGGTTINVNDGANMFIGNISLYTGLNNNSIHVYNGGNLFYCGNKTPVNEQLGTIHTGGTLNFALGYYTTETPGNQGDFSVSGNETAAFENAEVCRASFYGGTPFGEELLPIELTMLHATCSNGTIHIAWQTASEQNNDFFTVYRSFDGIVFTAIATVSGAGNSNSLLNYMYDDNTLAQGIVYYKLAQTDYDGTTVYSKILAVSTCGNPAIYSFKEGEIDITFENKDIPNHVIITSIDGKILFSKVFIHVESASIATSFASGVYIVSTIGNKTIISEKFVVN
ncbi:MAG TPA: T9SS type A sorting domain-containing protein, partial [Bacteroidales bacterium]|nr:T9SS type A sorting domain-containing protein [Bacteroidales bacterium]